MPHVVSITFMERKTVSYLCLYLDFTLDESYSAKKLNIKAGSLSHDLVDIITIDLAEPTGWVIIPLHDPYNKDMPLRVHLIQLRVLAMHQNGRDTHLRQIKIFGPRSSNDYSTSIPTAIPYSIHPTTTTTASTSTGGTQRVDYSSDLFQFSQIR